jgi:hypothetical protein
MCGDKGVLVVNGVLRGDIGHGVRLQRRLSYLDCGIFDRSIVGCQSARRVGEPLCRKSN